MCVDDGLCASLSEACVCADCVELALCNPDQCVDDQVCTLADACTCPDCATEEFCNDPSHCKDDGVCDSYTEGCACADCEVNPSCATYTGTTSASASSSAASSGSGGSASSGSGGDDDSVGCALRPGTAPVSAGALALGAVALMIAARRRR
jgi:hypothetical protein